MYEILSVAQMSVQIVARNENYFKARVLLVFLISIDLEAFHFIFAEAVHATIRIILDIFKLVFHASGGWIKFAPIFVCALVQTQNFLMRLSICYVEHAGQKFDIFWIILYHTIEVPFDCKRHSVTYLIEINAGIEVVEVGLLQFGNERVFLVHKMGKFECGVADEHD